MKLFTKIAAGTLLAFGLFVNVMATAELLDPENPSQEKEGGLAALMMFGVPATVAGSWMFWQGHRKFRQQEHQRLRAIFFQVLEENQGHINVLQFARATGIEGSEAKTLLEDYAKEFNATYNVTEQGNIAYYFEIDTNKHLPDSF